MDISLLGNINAVNRSLLTHKQEDAEKDIQEAADAERQREILSRESELSPVPPAHASAEIPHQDDEAFIPQRQTGKQINIKI